MKLLFTSVGRRVELIRLFRQAATRLGQALVILGGDLSPTAPALAFCDRHFTLPPIASSAYIPTLLKLCREEGVDALIPTIDTDLLILAQHREEFACAGIRVCVCAPEAIAACRDKRRTYELFASVGLVTPRPAESVADYAGGFPAFIKPRDGSSSINSYRACSREELCELASRVPDYIIQPFVEGTEYTVDVFCDWSGEPIYITPRVRLAVRSGEVLKTQICHCAEIEAEIRRLIATLRPCGPLTVQLIRDAAGVNHYIEINPRFGGGAPLSMRAGADSAAAMLRLLSGEKLDFVPHAARDGAVYSRFDDSICVSAGEKGAQDVRAVIFDLDDTLYPERSYVYSGFAAVAAALPELPDVRERLIAAFEAGEPAFDAVLGELPPARRAEMIALYRTHQPQIELYPGVRRMLVDLRARGMRIGVITDGRPVGQRQKLQALGLEALVDEIIVTDELGGIAFRKPDDISFRIMQRRLGVAFEACIYVGDNAAKDFLAPRQLGMRTCHVCNGGGLYEKNRGEAHMEIGETRALLSVLFPEEIS